MKNTKPVYIIASFLFLFTVVEAYSQRVNFESRDHMQQSTPRFLNVDEEIPSPESRTLATSPNIRLYPYYDSLTGISAALKAYITQDLVPPVLAFFTAALKVKYPLKSPLKLPNSVSRVCYHPTPTILKTTGVDADTFILFTASSEESEFIAVAQYCYLASISRRPIVTTVEFNTNWLQLPNGNALKHEKNINALIHELVHTFGFSPDLYPYFLDESGDIRTNHVKTVTLGGKKRTILDVPPLTSRLRRFFGCSSLPGAYLENDGSGSLTQGSHFERKFFAMEVMTSGLLNSMVLSEFTLALLEGSGWYQPDYSYADPYYFGAGQGCSFFQSNCSNNSGGSQFKEFCTTPKQRGCAATGRVGGYCRKDSNSDECMFYTPTANFDCQNPAAVNQTRLSSLQVFGRNAGSKCFEGTLSTRSNDKQNTFCFSFTCTGSGVNTKLEVQIGTRKLMCDREGPMTVQGYFGTIECPDPLDFCQTAGKDYCPKNCMGRGKCQNNRCVCNNGFTGTDCSLRV